MEVALTLSTGRGTPMVGLFVALLVFNAIIAVMFGRCGYDTPIEKLGLIVLIGIAGDIIILTFFILV